VKTRSEPLPEFVREAIDPGSPADEAALAESLAALASALEPIQPSAEARRRLLAAVSARPERHAPFFERLGRFFDLPLGRIREIMGEIDMVGRWEPAPMPGVQLMHFAGGPTLAGADTGLVRVEAGLRFPLHRHLGTERIMVLEGGYHDDTGRFYGPGHVHEMQGGTTHTYTVLEDQSCLLALVLYAGIELVTP
jgi:hypothetical protein